MIPKKNIAVDSPVGKKMCFEDVEKRVFSRPEQDNFRLYLR